MTRHTSGIVSLTKAEYARETRPQRHRRQCRNVLIMRRRLATRFSRAYGRVQPRDWRERGNTKKWLR